MVKQQEKIERVRIDKYLWTIRIFKTRNIAKLACEGGRIKQSGKSVKPAHFVNVGDRYEIKSSTRNWHIEIIGLTERRLSFSDAILYYKDLTNESEKQNIQKQNASFYTGKRLSKTGKPSKQQRRHLESLL